MSLKQLFRGLDADDPLHKFCIGCEAPFLSLFFRKKNNPVKRKKVNNGKKHSCGCGG